MYLLISEKNAPINIINNIEVSPIPNQANANGTHASGGIGLKSSIPASKKSLIVEKYPIDIPIGTATSPAIRNPDTTLFILIIVLSIKFIPVPSIGCCGANNTDKTDSTLGKMMGLFNHIAIISQNIIPSSGKDIFFKIFINIFLYINVLIIIFFNINIK